MEATDADGDTVTYSVSGTDASAVSINASSGGTFNSAPDHETKTSYAITVTASDGTNTTDQSVIIEITDLNDSGQSLQLQVPRMSTNKIFYLIFKVGLITQLLQ